MAKKGSKTAKPKSLTGKRIEEFVAPYWNHPMWWGISPVPDLMAPLQQVRVPKMNLLDLGSELLVEAELPGVTREGLSLTALENTLSIRAVPSKEEPEGAEYFYREIGRGEYQRTLLLPCAVDWDKSEAVVRDGWLELRCPKIITDSGEPGCRSIPVE